MITVEPVAAADPVVQTLLQEWKPEKGLSTSGDRYVYVIARLGDEPVAVLEGHHDYGNWRDLEDYRHLGEKNLGSYISSLYVKPSHRRRGAADALLDWFIEDARRHGSIAVVAWPDEDDSGRDARVALNRKHGLAFARVHENFQAPWLMILPLQ